MSFTLGLSLALAASPNRLGWVESLAGVAPTLAIDAPRWQFARNAGAGLQSISAAQLAAALTVAGPAADIDDGLGGTVAIGADELKLSRAGIATLSNADKTWLGFDGSAVAFVAELDIRALAAVRVIEFNDGSLDNWSSLTVSASNYMTLAWKSGGTYQGSSAAAAAISTGICRVYGVSAPSFLQVGVTGVADGIKRTTYTDPVGLTRLALDGVGFDTTTPRAEKYLRRFNVYPIPAGSDALFDAVKAIATAWAA